MAYPSEQYGWCSNGSSRVVLVLVTMFLVAYIWGSPLSLKGRSSKDQYLCTCDCDCSEEFALPFSDFNDSSYEDCGKHDPYLSEEMGKNNVALIAEEITLLTSVANETLERTRAVAADSRKASLHYQREAEKCNAQMEACEEARQRAEAELVQERRLSALWEQRAREVGFTDS